jgi:hypothetical protein
MLILEPGLATLIDDDVMAMPMAFVREQRATIE